jgi:hypothetical protein
MLTNNVPLSTSTPYVVSIFGVEDVELYHTSATAGDPGSADSVWMAAAVFVSHVMPRGSLGFETGTRPEAPTGNRVGVVPYMRRSPFVVRGLASRVPLVGRVTLVFAVVVSVVVKAPLVVRLPPSVMVFVPLFTPVPP